jgi:hypothetical protein
VSPVKYELGFYIPEDDILHSPTVKTSNLISSRRAQGGDTLLSVGTVRNVSEGPSNLNFCNVLLPVIVFDIYL